MTDRGVVAIAGSTGLVGKALVLALTEKGYEVRRMVRPNSSLLSGEQLIRWDPGQGKLDASDLEGVTAVIHLGGTNVAEGSWTNARKQAIMDSRVKSTRLLSDTLASMDNPPDFICASAIGVYGNTGNAVMTEEAPVGEGFLADVGQQWEAAADSAREAGARVVHARIGIVLSKHGGALSKMIAPFSLGLGGKVGTGKQYWSWISLDDVVGILMYCLENPISGPVNVVAPESATNLEFTKALGKVLKRPTIFPLPAFVVSLLMGEMGRQLLLGGARVSAAKIKSEGYKFKYPDLEDAMRHALYD